jgi:hypothetical protein
MAEYPTPIRETPIFNPTSFPLREVNADTDLANLQEEIVILNTEADNLLANSLNIGLYTGSVFSTLITPTTPTLIGQLQTIKYTEGWVLNGNFDILRGGEANVGQWYFWWNYSSTVYNNAYNNLWVTGFSTTDSVSVNYMAFHNVVEPTSGSVNNCYLWCYCPTSGPGIGLTNSSLFPVGQTQNLNGILCGNPDYLLT